MSAANPLYLLLLFPLHSAHKFHPLIHLPDFPVFGAISCAQHVPSHTPHGLFLLKAGPPFQVGLIGHHFPEAFLASWLEALPPLSCTTLFSCLMVMVLSMRLHSWFLSELCQVTSSRPQAHPKTPGSLPVGLGAIYSVSPTALLAHTKCP